MPATIYAINQSLNYDFGKTAYTPPTTYYIGLSTTAVTSAGSATATEPGGGSYARVPITNSKSYWSIAASGSLVNTTTASFAQSSTAWGTIVSVCLYDNSTSGSIWFYYTLNPSVPVVANTVVTFSAGTITASRT